VLREGPGQLAPVSGRRELPGQSLARRSVGLVVGAWWRHPEPGKLRYCLLHGAEKRFGVEVEERAQRAQIPADLLQ
jgi:hypothetical protein